MGKKISELPEIDYKDGEGAWAVVTHEGKSQKADLSVLATDASVEEKIAESIPDDIATNADITAAVEGLATEEWVTEQVEGVDIPSIDGLTTKQYVDDQDQSVQRFATAADQEVKNWVIGKEYITEDVVTDAVDAQARTQGTVDSGQDTKISTLENKVSALEGTVVEAQFKADSRDQPTTGGFVLIGVDGNKAIQFSQALSIIFHETDFHNKPVDASKLLNGDIVRLSMSPTNYATYKVSGSYARDGRVTVEVAEPTVGPEDVIMEGFVYDFTHTTPFDTGNAATKAYVDAQDEVTLNAAKSYADSLDIPEAISTDGFLTDSGEQQVQTGWKVKAPGSSESIWTYLSLANAGELAINHLRNPTESHHAVNKGWVTSQHYVSTDSEQPLVNKTITWNQNSGSNTPKLNFSNEDEYAPQNHERRCLYGSYKSSGGSKSHWSFGFNEDSAYWNYDWRMGSNLTMRWIMGDQHKEVMAIGKTGVDMTAAFIVDDVDYTAVPEDKHEELKAGARKIDIGHRLRELKNILVNLKTALKTKSADAQQALLDVLENVEDI